MVTTPKSVYRGPVGLGGILGTSWWPRTPIPVNISGLAFGNGVLVNSTVATAPTGYTADGVNWLYSTSTSAGNCIAFGAGVFVRPINNTATAVTSPDGLTWTTRTMPATGFWGSIAYGAGLFVTTSDNSATAAAASSPDGITWTARTMPAVGYWRLAYGNGVFVAISTSTNVAATSPDGINWTTRTLPVATAATISFGGGQFLALCGNSAVALTSPDGVTWTQRTLMTSGSSSNQGWTSASYGAGMWVAVYNGANSGINGSFVATSPDAATWTKRSIPSGISPSWSAFVNNVFFIAGSSGATSHTGATTLYTAPNTTQAVVTDFYLSNPTSAAVPVTLSIDGVDLLTQVSVAANDKLSFTGRQVVDPGKAIVAYTNGSSLNVHLNGVEIS